MSDKETEKLKPTHSEPGGFTKAEESTDDGLVNDSFGTVNPADSSGTDEEKETGDAKSKNKNTRED